MTTTTRLIGTSLLVAAIVTTGCRTAPTTVVSPPAPMPVATATISTRAVWTPPIDGRDANGPIFAKCEYWIQDYDQAAEAFHRFALSYVDSDRLGLAVFMEAHSLRLGGHPLEAIKVYEQVGEFFPDDVELAGAAVYYVARCHATMGNTTEATDTYLRFVKDPRFAFHPLSAAARQHLEDLDPSLIDPAEHPIVTDTFAKAARLAAAGNLTAAYALYEEVAAFFPDHAADALWRLGQAAEANGDTDKAISAYRRGHTHHQDPRAKEALTRLGYPVP